MENIRIEIHMTPAEVKKLDAIAKMDGRSRKNYCETAIRSIIQSFGGEEKKREKEKRECCITR